MNKDDIFNILNDWNVWNHELVSGVGRPIYTERLLRLMDSKQVLVVTGPRRSGKSYILRQLMNRLLANGSPKNQLLFVNFEDARFTAVRDTALLDQIYETYFEFLRPGGTPVVFLDEVQTITGWERWVRRMHELGKATIIISGSNTHLLSRELATALTGRHIDLTVFPLSFSEFLTFNGIENKTPGTKSEVATLQRGLWREYLENGGFPEVVLRGTKQELLLGYFSDIVEKDLIRRYRVRKGPQLRELARWYCSNIATPTTATSVAKFLQLNTNTAQAFANHLESVYLIFFLSRFSYALKEQARSPRKVYAMDTGLARAVGFGNSENQGHLLENAVSTELRRRASATAGASLFYWKNQRHQEVDFVVHTGRAVRQLIQTSWTIVDPAVKKRELTGLKAALAELGAVDSIILTADESGAEKINGMTVPVIPAWQWMMEQE